MREETVRMECKEFVGCGSTFSCARWNSVDLDAQTPEGQALVNVPATQHHLHVARKTLKRSKPKWKCVCLSRHGDKELVPSCILWRGRVQNPLQNSSSCLLGATHTHAVTQRAATRKGSQLKPLPVTFNRG